MQLKKIHYLPSLNLLIEDMAAKVLEDIKQSSGKFNYEMFLILFLFDPLIS